MKFCELIEHVLDCKHVHAIALNDSNAGRQHAVSFRVRFIAELLAKNLKHLRQYCNGITRIRADHQSAVAMNNIRLEQFAPQLLTSVVDVVAVGYTRNQTRWIRQ